MKKRLDPRIEFMGNYYNPIHEQHSPDPLGFNHYLYDIPYNGKTYSVVISEQNNSNLYIPVVKDEQISLHQFLTATDVAPPNYALGLGCDVEEIDDEVINLIINYRRYTLLSFGGIQKIMDESVRNGSGKFLFSDIFYGD